MKNPLDKLHTTFALTLIGSFFVPLGGVFVTAPIVLFFGGFLYIIIIHGNNYKNKPIRRKFAKLYGFNVQECGCIGSHPSEWMEKELVYERSIEGAKVKFSKKNAGMKRCTQCGNYYHIVEGFDYRRDKHKRTCWPEEEPNIREELNHRVIEG